MKILLLIISIPLFLNFCNDKDVNSVQENFEKDSLPITVQYVREKNQVLIQIFPQSGFGIQIDAPNFLEIESSDGLTIVSKNLQFLGSPDSKKPEYYSSIKPMEVVVSGSGKINLKGKIFYCDFSKNICLPGRLFRILEVPNAI